MKSYEQLPEIIQSMRVVGSNMTGKIDQLITIYGRIAKKSCQGHQNYSFS